MSSWQLNAIPWHEFDPSKVNFKLLAQAKGAALVESNAADYVTYLRAVFADNPQFMAQIEVWGREEELHGAALRKWCEMADPTFNYDDAVHRFKEAYRLPEVSASVRGSQARELVARCVVETGTSTFYLAMRDSCEEPVLREICRRIAGDEVRHFNLFLKQLTTRYAEQEHVSRWARLKTVLERSLEVDDPELTFAHFAANLGEKFDPAQFQVYSKQYMSEAFGLYQPRHFAMIIPMIARAAGISIRPWFSHKLGSLMYWLVKLRYQTVELVPRSQAS